MGLVSYARHFHQILKHLAALGLANARDEILKTLVALPFLHKPPRDPFDHRGHVLGRHRTDGETVRARVVLPLAAEQHLKMRHLAVAEGAAVPIKTDVGQMMLAAGIEAAAHLDAQALSPPRPS